ncbi:MAG TPA: endonuclease [Candidatus Sumerlaeota bacterium]|nr:endonuclease [Candidatus Sumerlaeota bacterium]
MAFFPHRQLLFLTILMTVTILCAQAQIPEGYYDEAMGLTGNELRGALHNIIKDHRRPSWSNEVTDIIRDADRHPDMEGYILDIYKNEAYLTSDTTSWEREHSWPSSYGFTDNTGTCNYPFADCHHLFAADASYNSSRGNSIYDYCTQSCEPKYVTGYPALANYRGKNEGSDVWETWLHRRGDVARALFYLDVRYEGGTHGITGCDEPDLILTNNRSLIVSSPTHENFSPAYMGVLNTLLEWHLDDPVDDREIHRNDVVFAAQGNRNPFIDHPGWVYDIWVIEPTPTQTPAPTPTPTPTPLVQVTAGEIVINEIDYDNPGGDTQSFIELKNKSHRVIDLSRLEIIGLNNSSTTTYFIYSLKQNLLPPGGYWVLGTRDDSSSVTTFVNETMTGVANLQNGPNDGIYIRLKDMPEIIIDSVCYEGDTAHPSGSPDSGNAGEDSTSENSVSLSRYPDGKDTNDNTADFQPAPHTPGASNGGLEPTPTATPTPTQTPISTATPTPTQTPTPSPTPPPPLPIYPGEIVINELDYDNTGKDTQNFIEIRNTTDRSLDLSHLQILGLNNSPTATYFTYDMKKSELAPGEYWVLGTRDDSTSVTAFVNEVMTGVGSLQNGPNDGVFLRLKEYPAIIIDSVCYAGETAHPAGSPDSGNAGVDPSNSTGISLSRIPDSRDTGRNQDDFQAVAHTPGGANIGAATPTPTPTPAPIPVTAILLY